MRLMWSCNVAPTVISSMLKTGQAVSGGWLDKLCEQIIRDSNCEFYIVVPGNRKTKGIQKRVLTKNVVCYSIDMQVDNNRMMLMFCDILAEVKPHIIHQFGTELVTSSALSKAVIKCGYKDHYIVTIQGVTKYIAQQYSKLIPPIYLHLHTIIGFLKKQDICDRIKHLSKMAKSEGEILNTAKYVLGRTDLDYAYCKYYGNTEGYIKCGETLRNVFYEGNWNYDEVEPLSIFSSTNSGPVKGLHVLLDAFCFVLIDHPDSHLYLTGKNVIEEPIWRLNSYELFIRRKIKKHKIESNVFFLGCLSAEEMKKRMIKSNVVVVSSIAENSSNFLGEAMLLGVPCVASDVGGTKEFLVNEKEGFCYQYDSPELLAYYIIKVFENNQLAIDFSRFGKSHAKESYNKNNTDVTLLLYKRIIDEQNNGDF